MLKNEYLVAKIGVDTAENEPLQVWGVIQFNIHFTPYSLVFQLIVQAQGSNSYSAARLIRNHRSRVSQFMGPHG